MGSDNGTKSNTTGSMLPLILGPTMPLAIGTGLAWGLVFAMGGGAANDRIAQVGDTKWAFASAIVLGITVRAVNLIPTYWKSDVLSSDGPDGKNMRVNPFVYKTLDAATDFNVVLATNGSAGAFNRANRSLQHMVENISPLLASLYMASTIFPGITFGLTVSFGLGRIWHAVGYANGGYGAHAPGFMLSTLSMAVLEGLCMLVVLKA